MVKMNPSKIQQLWEFFIQADPSSYERSAWLDVFLAELLAELKDGTTVEEVLSFGAVGSMATLIGCELMADIRQICSQSGDNDDLAPVLQYCLEGRGWRCLAALCSLGVENMSCARELAELLIFIYPVCFETPEQISSTTKNRFISKNNVKKIEAVLKTRVPLRHKFRAANHVTAATLYPPRAEFMRSISNSSTNRARRHRTQSGSDGAKGSLIAATSDSEHQGEDADLSRNRSNALKIRLDPMDFIYFTTDVRSEDESRLESVNYTPHRFIHKLKETKKSTEEFKDERLKEVLNSKVNAFEFMQLVIEVLQNLCNTSLSVSADNSHQVSVQVIKFSQKNLCSLQFGNSPPEFLTFVEVAELKSAMTRLFLCALEKILLYPELTTTVIHNGILPVILKILEDAISKVSASIKLSEENSVTDGDETSSIGSLLNGASVKPILAAEADKIQEFIFGTMYGIITFQYCFLLQKCTIDKLRDFLEIFQLFMESHDGRLVEKTILVILSIPYIDAPVSESRAKKVIDLVGQLTAALKKVRSEIVHSHQCHRSRHRLCNSSFVLKLHHHHDLFGNVYSSSAIMPNTQQSCCIAFLFMVLVRLLQSRTVCLEPRVLRVMAMCGTCCCVPVGTLMNTLVDLCRSADRKSRALVFTLLEQTVYPELGAYSAADSKLSCIICSKNSDCSVATINFLESAECKEDECLYKTSLKRTIETVLIPCAPSSDSCKSPWKCVVLFKDLLVSPDLKLCYAITMHLLKVAPRCSMSFKRELIFGVFYPAFLSAKDDYLATKSQISKFTILSCLSMFSSLLSSLLFAEHFIGKGGLDQILDLISLPPFSKLCCYVLEIMATVEIARLECDWKNQGSVAEGRKADDLKVLPSLSMLQQALQASCQKVLAVLDQDDGETVPNEVDVPSRAIVSTDECDSAYLGLLGNVSVFWRSCANLALYSPLYRQYRLDERLLEESYHILLVILRKIVSGKLMAEPSKRSTEIHLHMKMLEATLTVLMCSTSFQLDSEGGCVNREMVLSSLQDALLREEMAEQVNLRHLCDALLRCSVVECSKEAVLPPCRKPRLPTLLEATTWDESLSDEEEMLDAGQGSGESSSLEDAYITADEGYDADVEQLEVQNLRCSQAYTGGDSSTTTSLEAIRLYGWKKYCRQQNILQPDLCSITIQLIVHFTKRFPRLLENAVHVSSVVHCIQRLVALCRDNPQNCVVLAKHGLIAKLLHGFSHLLGSRNSNVTEIQRMVLELVSLLAKHCITPEELALYLNFFKTSDPPVDMLLSPLVTLVVGNKPQPNYILCFPADVSAGDGSSKALQTDSFGIDNLASNLAVTMHQQHVQAGVSSSWSNCAVALPINTDLGWSMWLHGFSLSMWLRLEKGSTVEVVKSDSSQGSQSSDAASCSFSDWGIISDNWNKENPFQSCSSSSPKSVGNLTQLHVFSIGYETLVLETWVDTIADTLVLRLTRPDAKCNEMITESTVENILPPGQWHHLAINVKDYMQKRKNVIEVVLVVNGYREVKVLMTFGGLLVRKTRATVLLLGQTSPVPPLAPPLGACYVGSVMLFRSPVFTRERAMYLVGLGPNHINLTECDVDRRSPNFTSLFGHKTLRANIDWETILDGKSGNLKELQDNLLLIYSAQSPNVVSVYPQVVTNPSSMVSSFFPGQPGFRVVTPDQRASQQLPLPVQPVQFSTLSSHQYQGMVAAATLLGGTTVFLFLFARVVELESCQEDQAKALYLLLKLVQSDSELFSQFVNQDCYKLLHRVLSSPRCTAGHHILKAILDTCCDKPVLQFHPGLRKFQVVQQSDAIIINSFLLSTIVGSWRDWESSTNEENCTHEEGGGVLGTLFRTLHVLLRDDHPYREFNAAQLNRVRMVDALLLFCKERFLYDESPQLHTSVACSLVELVRSLMGAPPEFCHVVAVSDFLVLLHRASATYVTHARSSFYFLLAPVPPSTSQGRNHSGNVQMSDEVKMKPPKKNTEKQNGGDFTQAIDPQKLEKALMNLQIQQNSVDTGLDDVHFNSSYKVHRTLSLPVDSNRVDIDTERNLDSGISGSYREGSLGLSSFMGKVSSSPNHTGFSNFPSIVSPDLKDSPLTEKISHKDIKQSCNDREKFTSETEMSIDLQTAGDQEKWVAGSSQCLVVEGLLMLLRDTLLVLPDNMAHQVLNHVVRAEALLVMANHSDPRVRTAVVKVLNAYLQRSTEEEVNKFVSMKGFHQLANQLAMYPATLDLVEACVCLITRCHISLEDQLETAPYLVEPSFLQLNSFPSLLALLPQAVHDVAVAHNVIVFLREIVSQVPNTLRPLLDCGLTEVLVKTLMAVAHGYWVPTDLCSVAEEDHLIGDVHTSLVSLAGIVLLSSQSHHVQVLNDLLLQLSFVEQWERESCGQDARCFTVARDAQCVLLEGALDILWDKITITHQPNAKIMNNVFLASVLSTSYDELALHSTNDRLSGMSIAYKKPAFSSHSGSYTSHRNKHHSHKEIPRSELNERFKSVLVKAVDFVINIALVDGKCPTVSTIEQNFSRRLLTTLLLAVGGVTEKKSPLWAVKDALRTQAGILLVWMISPVQSERTRMFVVHTLRGDPKIRDLLIGCLRTGMQMEQLSMFLWELQHNSNSRLSGSELRSCQELYDQLLTWGLASSSLVENYVTDLCMEEVRLLLGELDKQHILWQKQIDLAVCRSVYKFENLMKVVTDCAMSITRTVVEAQNSERKAFMEHIKAKYSENVHIRIKWQKIIQQLTHEKAVWFFPQSYPRSWQLDATEGPGRVRNRLQRCHLNIGEKYLMPSAHHKLDASNKAQPLAFLFERDSQSSTSSVLIERLHTNEKIQHMCTARVITPANEVPGELLIGESCLYFVADDSVVDTDLHEVTAGSLDVSSTAWQFDSIREIHNRRFQLQERALEIFLLNGKTYLIAFESSKERDTFVSELSQCQWINRQLCAGGDSLADIVQLWREGLITNWEYLTQLNKMAGRSYNDLMQYPVYPFVLSDYHGRVLDLTSRSVYRNFKKPMAVQDKKNEQHYINYYNYLKQEMMEGPNLMSLNQEPHHYGSHYSNSGTVLHFLVRLPPFTRMFLAYQDNNFDLPDRTFHSIYTTWRLTSTDSTTDVKELIPEFFYLPEFLKNMEDFNFGVRQNGMRVNHVELPPWCDNNARLFVLIHRQALESEYVREHLPYWIDLVFGYKQMGKAAVEAINVFHPATYYGFDLETIKDPLERTAWETMVRTYGQTPRQLFRSQHPMVIQSLSTKTPMFVVPDVIPGVKGLKWGTYVGSPSEPPPTVVWKQQHKTPVASLVSLVTNDVFGLAPHTSILLTYNKERGASMVNATSVMGAALVSWGHSDRVVRVKLKKEQPPWPVIKATGLDPICLCASAPDCNQLWLGHWSGKLAVYQYRFNPARGQLEFRANPTILLGHVGPVLSIHICPSFSIAVSSSQNKVTIIWDLNSLCYVRSLPEASFPMCLSCVSDTSGDIATVCNSTSSSGSVLHLHTINAMPVAKVSTTERITALCFSNAPEGTSVNVVAVGLATGIIRLFCTWDLSVVRQISSIITQPIISLTYSYDAQHLYAAAADGLVVIWEASGAKGISKTPKFLNLTSRMDQSVSLMHSSTSK